MTHNFKIGAICPVKNEDDIIPQTLVHATQYGDQIFAIDNGSTDQTWDVVRALASTKRRSTTSTN